MKKYFLSDNKIIDNNNNNVIAVYDNNKVELLDKRFSYNKIANIFKFADIPTQITEQRLMARSLFRQKTTDPKLSGVENMITQWSRPTYLRADSNEELKIEVDIWYNVMYLNKDQNGNDLRTTKEIETEKKKDY